MQAPEIPTLNIIGAGHLGRTLACLWHRRGVFAIGGICNRSVESSAAAREFIGAGTAAESLDTMPPAGLWLIAVPDDQIVSTAQKLASYLPSDRQTLVFHCSGALPASALASCTHATLASAHPVHSFADPQRSLEDLPGATVALEGDIDGMQRLESAFRALDCPCIPLSPEQKVLYHTGSVMACNYLTVLLDLSLQTFAAAGIDGATAKQLLAPIVLQTANNNFALGPERALTGPLVRGDVETVTRQLQTLEKLAQINPGTAALAETYRTLGKAALPLAKRAGLSDTARRQMSDLLTANPDDKVS
ncbi:Rossmann-like and DUF2520 domain-containing protein [Microbulbifer pacificus]|uniref:Rossmann-like and DUF2520 domain-containing protein n=1 Tax=Microbulbifer pacificus TaxID=407164 RepID=A0AAU0N298_9GAMM|nr:Rossmann-like and DUF2520 domain-containing protein [Microbulbifer pacificus]WOX06238.1 Rossmann-like and DUF2520 domain-containing protein [Microbulbifer pacificus]